jgi:hypothetical protein
MVKGNLFILGGVLLLLSGCAALDTLTGVNPDGTTDPSGGPVGSASNLLGSIIPWAGAGLGAIGTLYSQFRRKKYSDALKSVIGGVDAVRRLRSDSGEIKLTDEKFVAILKGIQESKKTDKTIKQIIEKGKK